MMKLQTIWLQIAKRYIPLCYCFLLSIITNAQFSPYNLVPNPGFEQYTNCPYLNDNSQNNEPSIWYKPDIKGARYYNSCTGNNTTGVPVNFGGGGYNFQYARTGNGYVVMFYYNGMDARNYIQVELLDSLRQGKCYYAEYYVSLMNSYRLGCNNQAMLFTNNPVYVDTNAIPLVHLLPANPQIQSTQIITDTLNWVKVSGVFTAQGGEKYLTLGNFKNNAQTAMQPIQPTGYNGAAYYLEDVSVLPLDSITLKADAGTDRTIIVGDSVFIGSYINGINNITWYNSTGNIIAIGIPGMYVKPTASTFYVIEQTVCGQYSKDTVYITVGVVPLVIKNYELKIKNEGVVNKWITLNEINVSHFNVQRSSNGIEFNTVQQTAAKNNAYNEYSITDVQPLNGTSYYRVEAVDKEGKKTYSKTLSITSNHRPQILNIYPNPAKGIININYPNIREVSILDMAGRKLVAKSFNNSNLVQLNVASLSKGIYILQAINNKGDVQTQKLIIE
jgi:hypothetical protein